MILPEVSDVPLLLREYSPLWIVNLASLVRKLGLIRRSTSSTTGSQPAYSPSLTGNTLRGIRFSSAPQRILMGHGSWCGIYTEAMVMGCRLIGQCSMGRGGVGRGGDRCGWCCVRRSQPRYQRPPSRRDSDAIIASVETVWSLLYFYCFPHGPCPQCGNCRESPSIVKVYVVSCMNMVYGEYGSWVTFS